MFNKGKIEDLSAEILNLNSKIIELSQFGAMNAVQVDIRRNDWCLSSKFFYFRLLEPPLANISINTKARVTSKNFIIESYAKTQLCKYRWFVFNRQFKCPRILEYNRFQEDFCLIWVNSFQWLWFPSPG